MKKFKIAIEETVVDEFEVEASSEEEALLLAMKKYKKGEIVLSPGELQAKQMAIVKQNKKMEWIPF